MTAPTPDDVELVANAYHWASRNSCGPDNCPGVPECIYAEHLSWDSFVAVVAALGDRLLPPDADTRPDLWQYGCPDPDEGPDAVMIFDGEPRHISPRYLRRPMRAVGSWVPVPTTPETP